MSSLFFVLRENRSNLTGFRREQLTMGMLAPAVVYPRPVDTAAKLRARRAIAQLTLTDLAAATAASRRRVRRYETGESDPSSRWLALAARALDCDVSDLVGDPPPTTGDRDGEEKKRSSSAVEHPRNRT